MPHLTVALALAAAPVPQHADARPLSERWTLDAPAVVVPAAGRSLSGLAFTPRGNLLVVDDHGKLSEWTPDGGLVREVEIPGRPDLEDVCVEPDGRHALLVVEDTAELVRVALDTFAVVARFESPRAVTRSKKGVESLLVVDVEGGRELWLGHQGDEVVYAVAYPPDGAAEPRVKRTIDLQDEARALARDPATGHVLVAADDRHELRLVGADGRDRDRLPFQLGPQSVEGVAVDSEGRLFVCTDGGDVVRFPVRVAAAAASERPRLVHLADVDVPAWAPEIAGVSADRRFLFHVDDHWRTLEVYDVDWRRPGSAPALAPRDFDDEWDGPQGVPFSSGITSVAAHPTLPLALVTTIGRTRDERGTLTAVDLRPEGLGRSLWFAKTGCHPDSVAISPDGRWAVVADEGEGDDRASVAPGGVSVFALHAVDALEHRCFKGELPAFHLDVARDVAVDAGEVEPEYVAIDPRSRFAVVTCQENDAAVVIGLGGAEPRVLPAKFFLPEGSEPDGAAVLDGYVDPELGPGALVAFAEEGRFDRFGRWRGQSVSLHWLGPEDEWSRTSLLARADVAAIVGRAHCAPEAVVLARRGGRVLLLAGIERADRVLLFDATDARTPRLLESASTGKRPEGLVLVRAGDRDVVVASCEGNDGPGEVTFLELRSPP